MKQKTISIGLAIILALTTSLAVVAQSENSQSKKTLTKEEIVQMREEARQKVRDRLSAEKEARVADRCQQAQSKIGQVQSRANQFQQTQATIYENWQEKANSLLTRLQNQEGVDATQLAADLQELDGLVEELQATLTDYNTELTELSNMSCSENPQQFYDSLELAREYRKTTIEVKQTVKTFIQETIKADFLDIKSQLTAGDDTQEGA